MNQIQLITVSAVGYITLIIVWVVTNPGGFSFTKGMKAFITGQVGRVIFGLFFLNILGNFYFRWLDTGFDFFLQIIGLSSFIFGIAIAVWVKMVMKDLWNVPAAIDYSRQNKLITTGPFKFSRNPIYLGILLILFGQAFFFQSFSVFLLIPFFFYLNRFVLVEEKLLSDVFREKYARYKNNTPRWV